MRTFWILLIALTALPALVLLSACAPRQSDAELEAEMERDLHEARLQRQQMLQDYERRGLFPAPNDLSAPSPPLVPRTPASTTAPPSPSTETGTQGSPDVRYPRSRQPFADPLLPDPIKSGTIVEPLGSRQPPAAPLAPHYEMRSPSTQQQYQNQQNQRRDQIDRDFDARREWQHRRDLLRK